MVKNKKIIISIGALLGVALVCLITVLLLNRNTGNACPYRYKISEFRNGVITVSLPKNKYKDGEWVLGEDACDLIDVTKENKARKTVFTFTFSPQKSSRSIQFHLTYGDKTVYTINAMVMARFYETSNGESTQYASITVSGYYAYYDTFTYQDSESDMTVCVQADCSENSIRADISAGQANTVFAQYGELRKINEAFDENNVYTAIVYPASDAPCDISFCDTARGRTAVLHLETDDSGRIIPVKCTFQPYSESTQTTAEETTDEAYRARTELLSEYNVELPAEAKVIDTQALSQENKTVYTIGYGSVTNTLTVIKTTDKSATEEQLKGLKTEQGDGAVFAIGEQKAVFVLADSMLILEAGSEALNEELINIMFYAYMATDISTDEPLTQNADEAEALTQAEAQTKTDEEN